MTDQLPGLVVHLHEGRLTGPFDLPPADMAQVRFEGRVMVVVVADIVAPLNIVTTKDGDHKAKWTFKAVDVALVRDADMQHRLSNSLHMLGVEEVLVEEDEEGPKTPGFMGKYDEEGAFLGFEQVEETFEEDEELLAEEEEPEERLFHRNNGRTPPRIDPPVEGVERYGKPIERTDDALSAFLNDRGKDRAGVGAS